MVLYAFPPVNLVRCISGDYLMNVGEVISGGEQFTKIIIIIIISGGELGMSIGPGLTLDRSWTGPTLLVLVWFPGRLGRSLVLELVDQHCADRHLMLI